MRARNAAAALALSGLTIMAAPSAAVETTYTAAASARPNVLVIVTDDQRADALRYMRATKRLFRRGGTTFTNAYATTPVCCPSRASILTGRYVHNHGVLTQSDADSHAAEAAEEMMIQRALKRSGYATALFGKFLNNWDLNKDPEHLDEWAIFGHSAPHGYRGGTWNVNGRLEQLDRYSTKYLRDRAIDFMTAQEETDGQPWFLYLAPAAPHAPFEAEPRYQRARVRPWRGNPAVREADRTDKPLWVQQKSNPPRKGRRIRRAQLRTLMSVDDLVGALAARLRHLGEGRRTLMVYTSDNGFLWGEHGLGTKRWPYIRSTKIPMMIRWPDTVPRGVRDTRIVANIDIAPTIADVARVTLAMADGHSLLSRTQRSRLLLEYFRPEIPDPPTWASTLTPSYQYIEYYDDSGVVVGRELYDLVTDWWQLTNVLGDLDPTNDPSPTQAAELSLQLGDDRDCAGSDCP